LTESVAGRWESALERGGLHLTEPEARYFFRQFIGALEYCHLNKVAHRWVEVGLQLRLGLGAGRWGREVGQGGGGLTAVGL